MAQMISDLQPNQQGIVISEAPSFMPEIGGKWWTSTYENGNGRYWYSTHMDPEIHSAVDTPKYGFSVRCIKD